MKLSASEEPLCEAYDVALLDLDGVVYVGDKAVVHAPESLAQAAEHGMHLAYVTNNASRPPWAIAHHLRDLGLNGVDESDVVTSAQAAARLVARQVPPSGRVLVVGGDGLIEALEEHGLTPVGSLDEAPVAVVQGFAPDLDWKQLAQGTFAVRAGLPWIASNMDLTFPTPRGGAPGNGSFVRLIAGITGRKPDVAGKPQPPLFEETLLRVGGQRPLVVGDRLDTDILGAELAGLDSLLVLTGVTDLAALVHTRHRPKYVAVDLRGLLGPQPPVVVRGDNAVCGSVRIHHEFGRVRPQETAGTDANELLRAVVALAWHYLDRGGDALDISQAVRVLDVMMDT